MPKQAESDKQVVAIKKVKDIFQSDAQAHRVLRELRLLRLLRDHPNIVKLLSIMRPKDTTKFNSLNIVTDYCT
jgi:serine/threonine protein kinase